MKNLFTYLLIITLSVTSYSQIDFLPSHSAYRYSDTGYDEYTHYTPGDISFWTDLTYSIGSSQFANFMQLFDNNTFQSSTWNLDNFVMRDAFADRVKLDYDGLTIVNSASWTAYHAYVRGNGGQIDLYNGLNGNYLSRIGSTSTNSDRGNFQLLGNLGRLYINMDAGISNQGIIETYGENGNRNVRIGGQTSSPNLGFLYVADENGFQEAGMYVSNTTGEGVVYADVKNFKVPHPNDDTKDIWYASIEGPEAAIYERGTAQLINGSAFIPFSDHFAALATVSTMTVQVTPSDWDTYGIAVIKKTKEGFYVKELKNGSSKQYFDWECKSVRKGKEDYQVLRSKDFLAQNSESFQHVNKKEEDLLKLKQKPSKREIAHSHYEGCGHKY